MGSQVIGFKSFLIFSIFVVLSCRLHAQDSLDPGSFQVIKEEYGMGDFDEEVFLPVGFSKKIEMRASVHYPAQLSKGPFPLVVLLHGWHDTCFKDGVVKKDWPCDKAGGWQPIPSYAGYDYMANNLASHGYIVVSVSANGITASEDKKIISDSVSRQARAELIRQHLALWHAWNISGSGPFGNKFVGAIDTKNIGLMGHSRGGGGVAAYHHYFQKTSYKVKAVLLFAPINTEMDSENYVIDNAHLGLVLPYCDGDVVDLAGVRYYDTARYSSVSDETNKHAFLVMGANHNFFNTVWTPGLFPAGAKDDFIAGYGGTDRYLPSVSQDYFCSKNKATNMRLTDSEQRSVGGFYFSAFFRAYLGGEAQLLKVLAGDAKPSFLPAGKDVHVSYHAGSKHRLDINRMDVEDSVQVQNNRKVINNLGGQVFASSSFTKFDICGDPENSDNDRSCMVSDCDGDDPVCENDYIGHPTAFQQPHLDWTRFNSSFRVSQLLLEWYGSPQGGGCNNAPYYENSIPVQYKNIRRFSHLQFRAGVNFQRSPLQVNQDFSIEIRDSFGNKSCVSVSGYSSALFFPPGYSQVAPKLLLNTVNIPLSAFRGVDLASVTSVRFVFDKTYAGALSISDIAFSNIYQKSRSSALINIINTVF